MSSLRDFHMVHTIKFQTKDKLDLILDVDSNDLRISNVDPILLSKIDFQPSH